MRAGDEGVEVRDGIIDGVGEVPVVGIWTLGRKGMV